MNNLYLFELSDVFADQVYLPYSSGVVWSYVNSFDEINKNYELKDWFFARDDKKNIINKIKNPDVLLFSCFMWNWNLNCEIAKELKKKYPDVLICFGGQHQPLADRNDKFFKDFPYVDILIHHEGEETVKEILIKYIEYKKIKKRNILHNIFGTTLNDNGLEKKAPPRKRLDDISQLPSPYLDGSFDFIVKKNRQEKNYSLHATVESVRGCPFSCAFCEIGDKYYQKIKSAYATTKKEIDWISKNKIEYVTDANSNFGILFEEDMDLANYIVAKKIQTSYPQAYRVTWAKGQADKVLKIAKLFEEHDIQKGMTIALQSMNENVLKAVQRKNVDNGKLQEFITRYEKENISSYVELIWGLPEETIESFKKGILDIIEMNYHNYLDVHLMMVLPNAPISSPGFIEKYGLKVTYAQPRFSHRSNPTKLVDDLVGFVTATNTCSHDQWIEGHQFRWLIIFSHYLGPLQYISRGLNSCFKIKYADFYNSLFEFCKTYNETFISKEYYNIKNNLSKILKNKRHWGDLIQGVGDINWEVDEATCIRLIKVKDNFYKEIKEFILDNFSKNINDVDILDEIIKYQKIRLHDPNTIYPKHVYFETNIHEVITGNAELKKELKNYKIEGKNFHGDIYNWAKNILWFGRRTGAYKTKITNNNQVLKKIKFNDGLNAQYLKINSNLSDNL